MPDTPDPPRKNYGFKPKDFERVNAPRPEAGAAPETPPMANDVFAIRRDLRAREIATGGDELAPPDRPVRRRRKRDYWLLTLVINGVLIPLTIWGYRAGNLMVLVSSAAGLILANLGLWWIVWVLMDDY